MHTGEKDDKDKEPSRIHFWGGALSAGASVPYSWVAGGGKAAKKGLEGALVGGLFGLNSLFGDEEEDED